MRIDRIQRTTVVLGALVASMFAAAPSTAGTALGARAGLNISGLSHLPSYLISEHLARFGGGVFLTIGVNDLISIQPEALVVQKGALFGPSTSSDQFGSGAERLETAYLELPLLVRVTPPLGVAVRPMLLIGPAFSFELTEKSHTQGSDVGGSVDRGLLKDFDLGAAIGLGLEMIGGGGIWSLEGRSNLGLVDLNESGSDRFRNWNVLVSMGFARALD